MKARCDRAEHLPTWLAALWMLVLPLWHSGSYTRITSAKYQCMQVLLGVMIVGTLLAFFGTRRPVRRKRFRLHPVQGAAVAYLLWVLLSACLGEFSGAVNGNGQPAVWFGAQRYEGALTQCAYIAIFLLASLAPVKPEPVMKAAGAALLMNAAVTALQYAGQNPFGLFPEGRSLMTNYEFQGTMGNIDIISGWLCLILPPLLGGYIIGRLRWWSLACVGVGVLLLLLMEVQSGLIVLLLMGGASVLTALGSARMRPGSLRALAVMALMASLRLMLGLPWLDGTAYLCLRLDVWRLLPLAAGGLLWLASCHPGRWALPCRILLPGTALICVVAVMALYVLPMPGGTGLWELQEILHGRVQDSFGSERLGVWRMTLEISREHLLFGTGPDTFLYALQRHMAQTGQTLVQTFDNPHQMLLAVLCGSGLPALLLYLLLMGWSLTLAWRVRKKQPWAALLAIGVCGYLTQGMFVFSICLVTPLFWAMLGMTVSLSIHEEVEQHG